MGQAVTRFQIIAKDPNKSAEFYCRMFDWNVDDNNSMGYRMLNTGTDNGIQGGIWPAPPEGHSMVQLYVEVDDVPAAINRATELGSTVIVPHQVLPDGDEMAIILDPEGIPVGLAKTQ